MRALAALATILVASVPALAFGDAPKPVGNQGPPIDIRPPGKS